MIHRCSTPQRSQGPHACKLINKLEIIVLQCRSKIIDVCMVFLGVKSKRPATSTYSLFIYIYISLSMHIYVDTKTNRNL